MLHDMRWTTAVSELSWLVQKLGISLCRILHIIIPIDGYNDISMLDDRSESRTRSRLVDPVSSIHPCLCPPHPAPQPRVLRWVRRHGHLAQRSIGICRPQNIRPKTKTVDEEPPKVNHLRGWRPKDGNNYGQLLPCWLMIENGVREYWPITARLSAYHWLPNSLYRRLCSRAFNRLND